MTAPLAALLAAAWTLTVALGVWSVVGLYRLDRKSRRGGGPLGKPARRPCGAAGPQSAKQQSRALGQPGAGGPQT